MAMWRIFQSFTRNVRGQWNGTFRSAQQSLCHEDDKEGEVLCKTSVGQCCKTHQKNQQEPKLDERHSVSTSTSGSHSNDDNQHGAHFYHNHNGHGHCFHAFLESVQWGGGLILAQKLTQLLKFYHDEYERKRNAKLSWTSRVYRVAFHTDANSTAMYGLHLEKNDQRRNDKLEADVLWAKTPHTDVSESPDGDVFTDSWMLPNSSVVHPRMVTSLKSNRSVQTDVEMAIKQVAVPSHRERASNSNVHSVLEKFTNEWQQICEQCDSIHYNKEGLELASKGKYQEAIESWEKASELGSANASFNLGLCYEIGKGVEQNIQKAKDFYKLASDYGSSSGAYNLALIHLNAASGAENEEKAAKLLRKASDLGLAEAQTELGVLYTRHNNMKDAAELFSKASIQKDSNAQYFLGLCYENGWGVSENLCKAADLYSQASRHGNLQATYSLANFFENGVGGLPVNQSQALSLYEDCAEKGHILAAQSASNLKNNTSSGTSDGKVRPHLRISQSAPALSTHLTHQLAEFANIHPDEIIQNQGNGDSTIFKKSPTVDNFVLNDCDQGSNVYVSNDINDDLPSHDKNKVTVNKEVKFFLGNENSLPEQSDKQSSLSLSGGKFGGNLSFWQKPETRGSSSNLRRIDSDDRLSEYSVSSDDSDFSVVFDDNFEGLKLADFDSSERASAPRAVSFNVFNRAVRSSSVALNDLVDFDVFSSTCGVDEDGNGFDSPNKLQIVSF